MAQEINWHDIKDETIKWFILEVITETQIFYYEDFKASNLNIEMKINGKEVDFIKIMTLLFNQFDSMVEKEVVKKYNEKISGFIENLTNQLYQLHKEN